MATKTVIAAGLIIYRRVANSLEYLLLKASYGDYHWSPPKGHVDPGETELEAAMRETREEAGFAPEQLRMCDNFRSELHYQVRNKDKTVIYWLSELIDPAAEVKISDEHTDYKWLPLPEAIEYAQFADMQAALKDADNFLTKDVS